MPACQGGLGVEAPHWQLALGLQRRWDLAAIPLKTGASISERQGKLMTAFGANRNVSFQAKLGWGIYICHTEPGSLPVSKELYDTVIDGIKIIFLFWVIVTCQH